jgi:hypothetical protein
MKTKRERFTKVASYRTNLVIKYLKLLGNCSNKNNYDYTDSEISKIFSAIDEQIRIAKLRFKSKRNNSDVFKL